MLRPGVNTKFFNTWSPDMAYVLGFIFADGCLVKYKNGCHALDITSKDLKHLELIKQKLESGHKIGKKERGYRIQIRNKDIYSDLIKIGLTPKKSETVKFPRIPKRYFAHFIRGIFDGDGSVFKWRDPRWKHAWQIRTTFCSASAEFIKKLRRELIKNACVGQGYLRFASRVMELGYAISDSLVLYRFMYGRGSGFCLERKKKVFKSFLSSRENSLKAA